MEPNREKKCLICNNSSVIFSRKIGICPNCVNKSAEKAIEFSTKIQKIYRGKWSLEPVVPDNPDGLKCKLCSNMCSISEGQRGYCGIWKNENGLLISIVKKDEALLHTYYDPLPCNCCNSHFCPGGSSTGYPKFSYTKGPEYGFYNLACFSYGCNFSCLGCQNDLHKNLRNGEIYTFMKFLNEIQKNSNVSCICWFGGSPEPQLPWILKASMRARKEFEDRILRICFEWNGAGNPNLMKKAASICLESGGNIKFDLKYFSSTLSRLISGVSNEESFVNFKKCFDEFYGQRSNYENNPLLSAATLLIPGYVNKAEVEGIAQFLASLDKSIPYSLLIFYPTSYLTDLPITPKTQVLECYRVAKNYLKNVYIGNKHLLGIKTRIY